MCSGRHNYLNPDTHIRLLGVLSLCSDEGPETPLKDWKRPAISPDVDLLEASLPPPGIDGRPNASLADAAAVAKAAGACDWENDLERPCPTTQPSEPVKPMGPSSPDPWNPLPGVLSRWSWPEGEPLYSQ